jgi:NAD(P)-dependent dehydrogenase (short-subunit alcohol dehydrogenase family)
MSSLHGKVALVTGAAHGIGAAVASTLASHGAAVVVFDRDEEPLDAVVAGVTGGGGQALAVKGDVRLPADARAAVDSTVRAFGGIDLLACIAGVIRYSTVPDTSEDEWDFVLGTNLKGTYLFGHYAIPQMRMRKAGAIVNAASVMAFQTAELVPAYTASKGAIVSLTRAMALDHAKDGIRVNCIAPGSVRTPMLRYLGEAFGGDDPEGTIESWGREHPIGRLIEPEEVANVVAFLLSDEAAAVTGSCYTVDGGLSSKI